MKAIRKIVKINEDLCNGCGNCIIDCHEAAIRLIDGKAKIIKDSLCDGLGDCIGGCPTGALTIEEREAEEYNEMEVNRRLSHWPLKIRLVSPEDPVFHNADLVIAADCCAFSDPDYFKNLPKGMPLVIGCTKFDDVELYESKLTEIFKKAGLNSCTVVRMEVPCCGGLTWVAEKAAANAGIEITEVDIFKINRPQNA